MRKIHRITSFVILLFGVLLLLASCGGTTETAMASKGEAEKFNNLSANGLFMLYKVTTGKTEELKDKTAADMADDPGFKAFTEKYDGLYLTVQSEKETIDNTEYARDVYQFRNVNAGTRDIEGKYVMEEVDGELKAKKDENGNYVFEQETYREPGDVIQTAEYEITKDGETNTITRPLVYVEMADLGLEFKEDAENPGKMTLVAKNEAEERSFLYYIYMPVGKMLNFFNGIVPSYIFTLFIFAILVKILLFWFAYKQQQSMIKQAYFKPKERAIRNKYKGREDRVTQQKMQQEIMDAQRAEGVSVFGGCLPMLIQLPIIMILYQVIINPLSYVASYSSVLITHLRRVLCYNSIEGLNIAEKVANTFRSASVGNLSELNLLPVLRDNWSVFGGVPGMAEKSVSDLPNFYAFGNHIDLSVTPTPTFQWPLMLYLLIPIITFVALYFSMKLNRKLTGGLSQSMEGGNAGAANKIMDFAMPAMSTFFTFLFPALLGIYWIFNNLLGTAQQLLLNKIWPLPKFTEEDYKQAEREYNKGKDAKRKQTSATVSDADPAKPKGKSLHYDDEEEDYPVLPPIDEDKEPVIKDKKKGKFAKAEMKQDVEVDPAEKDAGTSSSENTDASADESGAKNNGAEQK